MKGMLNRIHRSAGNIKRPSRMPVITPQTLGMMHFCTDTAQKADHVCVHKHTFTCHKGKNGMICCRVSMPAGFKERTGPVRVTPSESAETPFETGSFMRSIEAKGRKETD